MSHGKKPENQLSAQDGVTLQNTQAGVYVGVLVNHFGQASLWNCKDLSLCKAAWAWRDSVTCCVQKQPPSGHGGSAEGSGYHLLLQEEGDDQGCFETTHDCKEDRLRTFI